MKKGQKYNSPDDGKIYQQTPAFSKPTQFKPKGWTDTVLGYLNEAKQLAMCLIRNQRAMKRSYTWAVHINLNVELSPRAVTEMWKDACRTLRRKGIVALWVREPNRRNKVHYHLLVKNLVGKRELEKAIEDAMPDRPRVQWRKRVEPIRNEWFYCHYIAKAKVSGHIRGREVKDLYAKKRLLFKTNLKLKKYGVIGNFWERPKRKLWDEIRETEKRIGEGLEKPNVKRLAKYVYEEFLGPTPNLSLKDFERAFGYWPDSEGVQNWIDSLLAGKWAENCSDA